METWLFFLRLRMEDGPPLDVSSITPKSFSSETSRMQKQWNQFYQLCPVRTGPGQWFMIKKILPLTGCFVQALKIGLNCFRPKDPPCLMAKFGDYRCRNQLDLQKCLELIQALHNYMPNIHLCWFQDCLYLTLCPYIFLKLWVIKVLIFHEWRMILLSCHPIGNLVKLW